jgi:ABC-2 type transport system ATP-binding protein
LVLLATHIVPDVEYIAKEIMILKNGKLVMQGTPKELGKSVRGKVWNVMASEKDMDIITNKYPVVNVRRVDNGFLLRIVCEDQPQGESQLVEPSLEDVFLSILNN